MNLEAYGLSESAAEAVEGVSRRHLALRVAEPAPGRRRMVVTDLGSSNGTTVERPLAVGEPRTARPGLDSHVMEKDVVVLGDAVTLRFSGKKYLAGDVGAAAPAAHAARPGLPRPTVYRVPR